MVRLSSSIALSLVIAACSKPEPDEPARTAPWRAEQPVVDAASSSLVQRYRLTAQSKVTFELETRQARISGNVGDLSGRLDIDLLDLTKSRTRLVLDLESLTIDSEAPAPSSEGQGEGQSDDYTEQAKNWLDLGRARKPNEREESRQVTFELHRLFELTSPSPHAGRVLGAKANANANAKADAAASRVEAGEVRAVELTAVGDLSLHGFKVQRSVRVQAAFHYPVAATPGARPTRIALKTLRPFPVSLSAHDIKPRDASGTVVARQLKLLGTKVASVAMVRFDLQAVLER